MASKLVARLEKHHAAFVTAAANDDASGMEDEAAKLLIVQATLRSRASAARKYAYKLAGYEKPALARNIAERILASDDDNDLINFLALNREAFEYTVRKALPHMHAMRPSTLEPGRKRSRGAPSFKLTCELVIALTLRWLTTRHRHKDLQLEFSCSQSCISRAIAEGLRAIVSGLKDDPYAKVAFPSRAERDGMAEMVRQQYGSAPYPLRIFACADGTLLLCLRPPTEEEQLRMYSGKDRVHCWNNIFVVSATGKIIAYSICWAGSTHDAAAASRLFARMQARLDADEHVAVDGGFPHAGGFVRPLQTGERLPADPDAKKKELRTSAHITTVRQAAEWINRTFKATFLRATMKLPWGREEAELIIVACILLLNLRTELVGFNQTRTVYSGAMDDRCLVLNALYAQLSEDDGDDRGREDDVLGSQVEQHGFVEAGPAGAGYGSDGGV